MHRPRCPHAATTSHPCSRSGMGQGRVRRKRTIPTPLSPSPCGLEDGVIESTPWCDSSLLVGQRLWTSDQAAPLTDPADPLPPSLPPHRHQVQLSNSGWPVLYHGVELCVSSSASIPRLISPAYHASAANNGHQTPRPVPSTLNPLSVPSLANGRSCRRVDRAFSQRSIRLASSIHIVYK
ncbi:hypothetical protein L209DRAFT_78688 [Thermothelomyces heterothallicus CBS 203.75]